MYYGNPDVNESEVKCLFFCHKNYYYQFCYKMYNQHF